MLPNELHPEPPKDLRDWTEPLKWFRGEGSPKDIAGVCFWVPQNDASFRVVRILQMRKCNYIPLSTVGTFIIFRGCKTDIFRVDKKPIIFSWALGVERQGGYLLGCPVGSS